MNKRNIEAIYPLTPMQKGMVFHNLYDENSLAYNEAMTCELKGNLDTEAFKIAWQMVVNDFPVLRTSFAWKKIDRMLQIVHKELTVPLEILDWSDNPSETREQQISKYIDSMRKRGFDLSKPPLIRLTLIRLEKDLYQFIWLNHHALLDGWSIPIVVLRFLLNYEALRKGEKILKDKAPSFGEYVRWLLDQDNQKAKSYWSEELITYVEPVGLPIMSSNNALGSDTHYEEVEIHLSEVETELVLNFGRENQITQSTIIQGAWSFLLSKYNHVNDVIFGVTVSGRPAELPNVESMVGLCINTLPLRVRINPDLNIANWLRLIQSKMIENRQYEYAPLYEIQEWSEIPGGTSLFESILVFENYPVESVLKEKNFSISIENFQSFEQTNYPITLISTQSSRLPLKISYDSSKYHKSEVSKVIQHLANLIIAFAREPLKSLAEISMLAEDEETNLLKTWNQSKSIPRNKGSILELFAETVEKFPDQIALSSNGKKITFGELNNLSNKIARTLLKKGVMAEDKIGICLERSNERIISLLGVLKTGAAYIPLDPSYPEDRLRYMLEDGDVKLLITRSNLSDLFKSLKVKNLLIDQDWEKIIEEIGLDLKISIGSDNLAYIIYTSGSTGEPKGVMIEHHSLLNFVMYQIDNYEITPQDRVLQFLSFSFDAAGSEIFPTLCAGGTLVNPEQDYDLSAKSFIKLCENEAISVLHLPTTFWHEFASEVASSDLLLPETLRLVEVGGESVSAERLAIWNESIKRSKTRNNSLFINSYGPTETTITALDFKIHCQSMEKMLKVPIGRPIDNAKIFILDQFFHPTPFGVPGELFIGGEGVGRGYYKREDLSQENFINIQKYTNERIYRTGDLVRCFPDGIVEFIGRKDTQVKIRGFRVELAEIESALLSTNQVRLAAVLAPMSVAGRKLIAYLEPMNPESFEIENLRRTLKSILPDYMVPSHFIVLDDFPLTPSGKVDYRRLPSDGHILDKDKYIAPRTPTEEVLKGIWEKLLGINNISIHSNFIELGGHSLLITQLSSRIREYFDVEISIRDLFEITSLADMAKRIEIFQRESSGLIIPEINKYPRNIDIPLSFAQQRLWFLDQLSPGNLFYNIPVVLKFEGTLHREGLIWCFDEIIRRHEVLRTNFQVTNTKPLQVIGSPYPFDIPVIDFSDLLEDDQETQISDFIKKEISKPFDLSKDPLLRAILIKIDDYNHLFVFTIHHIISDGWSINVMINEFVQLYESWTNREDELTVYPSLEPLEIQYADFSIWQRDWLQGEAFDSQINYWKSKLDGRPIVLSLPFDHPRKPILNSQGKTISFDFGNDVYNQIVKISKENGATIFMTLLAAYQVLLSRYSGQEDILVGTPVANRNMLELEKLIGFFVNTLVIRTDLSNAPSFHELLSQVRVNTLEAYAHQDLPFELLVEALQPDRDLSHTPIFQTAFSFQNLPIRTIQLPGLMVTPIEADSGNSKFDLTLVMAESEKGLSGSIEYNTDLFEEASIHRMIDHYRIILEGIVLNPDDAVTNLNILTNQEKQLILQDWNKTDAPSPINYCVHELFETQVKKNPEAIAIYFSGEKISYFELNQKANKLAHYLSKLGIGKDEIVGISTDRSPEMIIGILGVLKAGGAYLPLDPSYPIDRLSFMIMDSQISVLLSQKHLAGIFPDHNARTIWLDEGWDEIEKEKDDTLKVDVTPQNLAYVIYTSGSTGKPKGTLLNHKGLTNLTWVQKNAFNIRDESKILQFSPYSFDASVWEIFMALANGASLVIKKQEILSSGFELARVLEREKVTNVTLPPSVLRVLPYTEYPFLETIIAAGEACTHEIVDIWANGRQFVNAYGPTETTVCASMYFCDIEDTKSPPIGRPIANIKLYILDNYLQPTPVGVPGELHVSGVNLARGYHNQKDLTELKFIPNPFIPGEKLYKTGDLVKYRADGNIEFLGRIDQQVKVRGFRIELGEIENTLDRHPLIRESVVVAQDDHLGDKKLVGYIVPSEEINIDQNEIKGYLRQYLPDYMVPSIIVQLGEFPISPSGKIDRQSLPDVENIKKSLISDYVAPRNKQEEQLAQICTELLGIDQVGIYDNFFELGGHSLLATQFISRVKDQFGLEVALRNLFENPTISGLSERMEDLRREMESEDEKINRLIEMIDELSEEEVLSLLEQRTRVNERRD